MRSTKLTTKERITYVYMIICNAPLTVQTYVCVLVKSFQLGSVCVCIKHNEYAFNNNYI